MCWMLSEMTDYAWRNVFLKTIRNGFKKAGFGNNCEEDEEVEGINKEKEADDNENAVPDLQEWNTIKSGINVDINFEDFLQVDNCLATCGTSTDAEIIDNVRGISDEEEEAEDHIDELKVSAKEAEKAVEILQTFFESQENVGHEGFAALSNIRRIFEAKKVRRQISLKIIFSVKGLLNSSPDENSRIELLKDIEPIDYTEERSPNTFGRSPYQEETDDNYLHWSRIGSPPAGIFDDV